MKNLGYKKSAIHRLIKIAIKKFMLKYLYLWMNTKTIFLGIKYQKLFKYLQCTKIMNNSFSIHQTMISMFLEILKLKIL